MPPALTDLGVRGSLSPHGFRRTASAHLSLPGLPGVSSWTGGVLLALQPLPLCWPKVTGVLTTVPATAAESRWESALLSCWDRRAGSPSLPLQLLLQLLTRDMAEQREIQIYHCYCSLNKIKWTIQSRTTRSLGLQHWRREVTAGLSPEAAS